MQKKESPAEAGFPHVVSVHRENRPATVPYVNGVVVVIPILAEAACRIGQLTADLDIAAADERRTTLAIPVPRLTGDAAAAVIISVVIVVVAVIVVVPVVVSVVAVVVVIVAVAVVIAAVGIRTVAVVLVAGGGYCGGADEDSGSGGGGLAVIAGTAVVAVVAVVLGYPERRPAAVRNPH